VAGLPNPLQVSLGSVPRASYRFCLAADFTLLDTESPTPALRQAHYLTQRYGGPDRASRIDWDKVAASADLTTRSSVEGRTFIKSHTVDGVVTP